MTQHAVDPCRCPLCGLPNACAMATPGQAASGPCWCTLVEFSADLLKQVPEAARKKACICAACVAASQDQAAALRKSTESEGDVGRPSW